MGWIDINDEKYKLPKGMYALLEVSGRTVGDGGTVYLADHGFYIGCWVRDPDSEDGRQWIIKNENEWLEVTVHAWMPLPKHYKPNERFGQEEDLMEHPLFDDDPDWLYRGDVVYEQMSIEDFLGGKHAGDE